MPIRFGSYDCINAAALLFIPSGRSPPPWLPPPVAPALASLFQSDPRWLGTARVMTLAGGCFWNMRPAMAAQAGVLTAVAGFTGGWADAPTYADVCAGGTGHVEAVQLAYDPAQTSFDTLLSAFWASHDPCSLYRQGADAGERYSPRVFTHSAAQLHAARQSRDRLQAQLGRQVQTRVLPAEGRFWEAGPEHQR